MVSMSFLPFMYSSEQERAELSHLFETDMHGEEFYNLSLTCGGQEPDELVFEIFRHSSRMGYMGYI